VLWRVCGHWHRYSQRLWELCLFDGLSKYPVHDPDSIWSFSHSHRPTISVINSYKWAILRLWSSWKDCVRASRDSFLHPLIYRKRGWGQQLLTFSKVWNWQFFFCTWDCRSPPVCDWCIFDRWLHRSGLKRRFIHRVWIIFQFKCSLISKLTKWVGLESIRLGCYCCSLKCEEHLWQAATFWPCQQIFSYRF